MTCASLAPLDFTCLQMLVDRNRRYQEHDQHYGDSRRNGPVLLAKNSVHRVWPIMVASEPPSKSGTTNSPTMGTKHKRAPAPRPRNARGSVMTKKVFQRGQPRSAAASRRLSSSFSKLA